LLSVVLERRWSSVESAGNSSSIKKLVCNAAPFFDKAFNGEFKERDGIMYLPEASNSAFPLFVDWLYCGKVPDGRANEYYLQLHKLQVFAEKRWEWPHDLLHGRHFTYRTWHLQIWDST
jgi:hypothetical protein